ncbi:Maff2 family protein [Aerococcaceae bacterium NML180378]|nr:Maff2 family protein [Aerococcaceae bacterium NML180378]
MAFFTQGINALQTIVMLIGGGLGVWGVVNLLEGYGNDNPGAKSQGIKQLMASGGLMIVAQTFIPQLATLFTT